MADKLNQAYRAINALGGAANTDEDEAYNLAITCALDILENLGAHDPDFRAALIAPGCCDTCDRVRAAKTSLYPPHSPSKRCESGGRNHCSCDVCF